MNIEVVKFDDLGRGIGYLNNKIIFIPKSVPGDIVNVKITKEKKKYYEGQITEIIKYSKKRISPKCPFFLQCGGCDLMHISLSDTLEYKLAKMNNIFLKNHLNYEIKEIIKSFSPYYYRNKVSLKIDNYQVGYFTSSTHDLIPITKCYLATKEINNLIKDFSLFSIKNGNITIRANYNNDLLINITSSNELCNLDKLINKYKIVGIIKNNKLIYGDNYFIEKINDFLFKVSYDAFFQVNPFICSELFNLISKYTSNSLKVLDLYCGVGTLGFVASKNAKQVLGVEINELAIQDANFNKKLNNINNISFVCADTKVILDRITNEFDTIILDPPRSGINIHVLNKIITEKISKIIYVSCNPETLGRDLVMLSKYYSIEEVKLLDMFPNTQHVESICLLNRQ